MLAHLVWHLLTYTTMRALISFAALFYIGILVSQPVFAISCKELISGMDTLGMVKFSAPFPETVSFSKHGGIKLNFTGGSKKVKKTLFLEETDSMVNGFLGETIAIGKKRFNLINIGYNIFRDDLKYIDQKVGSIDLAGFSEIEIQSRGERRKAFDQIYSFRKVVQNLVMATYNSVKSYLLPRDESAINGEYALNKFNSDTLVLLGGSSKKTTDLNSVEFEKQLLISIQLSRVNEFNPFIPSVFRDHPLYDTESFLPFQYRMRGKNFLKSQQWIDELSQVGPVAEITRYVKFKETLPRKVHAYMLLKLLKEAQLGVAPVRWLLISVDQKTRVQFERFNFSLFKNLEFGQVEVVNNKIPDFSKLDVRAVKEVQEPEFLMILDTKSNDHSKTLRMLEAMTKSLTLTSNN